MRELEVAVKARRRDGMVVDEVELGKYLRAGHEDRTKDERSEGRTLTHILVAETDLARAGEVLNAQLEGA